MTNEVFMIAAKVAVEELLLRRHSKAQIAAVMAKHEQLKLTKSETERIIREVKEEWSSAADDVREQRREQQRRSLENLYRVAFNEKRYAVCLGVERLLAEIDGTLAPKKFVGAVNGRSGAEEDEFADRSQAELEYFADHGRFPDEVH